MPKARSTKKVVVKGSAKKAPKLAKKGAVIKDEQVQVTVRVRRRKALPARIGVPLTREEFRSRYGADPRDIAAIETFAAQHGLDVVQASISQRSVVLAGTASAMKSAFGVTLRSYSVGTTRFRGRTGSITVPKGIAAVVEGVFGLDDRPHVRPHFRLARARGKLKSRSSAGPKTPREVATLYDFPLTKDGSGQCIAILELGGGFRDADLDKYFKKLGVARPQVSAVSILGGRNAPTGNPNGPDGEVMLDIEVAGAVAPASKIAVYFAPNTDAGFLGALRTAVHDGVRNPSVVSISWGGPEESWTEQSMTDFDQACQEAAQMGVTICVAAGDNGSSDVDPMDGRTRVDFPASSPAVLACGGTRLLGTGSTISNEVVWEVNGATGGGFSDVFPRPKYQSSKRLKPPTGKRGRGVPDVAGDADPNTGYRVRVDGIDTVIGGTSAVAPLWAGLVALLNQGRKAPVGFLNPKLYALKPTAGAFTDIVTGNNGVYKARDGWDPCTGLGTPLGKTLAKLI